MRLTFLEDWFAWHMTGTLAQQGMISIARELLGASVTRSVSATAKTGYSVRINFENMLRLAQAVSSCALWRSVDLEPVAPRTILDDDLGVLWPATCRTRS